MIEIVKIKPEKSLVGLQVLAKAREFERQELDLGVLKNCLENEFKTIRVPRMRSTAADLYELNLVQKRLELVKKRTIKCPSFLVAYFCVS